MFCLQGIWCDKSCFSSDSDGDINKTVLSHPAPLSCLSARLFPQSLIKQRIAGSVGVSDLRKAGHFKGQREGFTRLIANYQSDYVMESILF